MRINVYAEEMTQRIEVVTKETNDGEFTGLRIYLELPVTVNGAQIKGPFLHYPGDDDSAAITFWGKGELRNVLAKAIERLDIHHAEMKVREAIRNLNRINQRSETVNAEAMKGAVDGGKEEKG